jgi:hypothetical protein
MWPWILEYARYHYDIWLGMRLNNSSLHYGVRDGGFALLFVAQLATVHPSSTVRAEMHDKAVKAARDYYARLQTSNGGWYWKWDDGTFKSQPMMVGLLLEGMVATHRLSGDAAVGQSIVYAVDWLYNVAYETHAPTNLPDVRWRAMGYARNRDGAEYPLRGSAAAYGQEDGLIRDARQLNAHTLHAFGYAYQLTRDSKYQQWGDEVFSATFGKGQGPGADKYWGLADFREKEYNQSYRSGGHYLAWRVN